MPAPMAGNTVNAQDLVDGLAAFAPAAWSPTLTNLTKGGSPTEDGWYLDLGKLVIAQWLLTVGTSPSWSATITLTLPVAADGPLDAPLGSWSLRDASAGNSGFYSGTVAIAAAGGGTARLLGAWDGTAPRATVGLSGTAPFTLAVGDKVGVALAYVPL